MMVAPCAVACNQQTQVQHLSWRRHVTPNKPDVLWEKPPEATVQAMYGLHDQKHGQTQLYEDPLRD